MNLVPAKSIKVLLVYSAEDKEVLNAKIQCALKNADDNCRTMWWTLETLKKKVKDSKAMMDEMKAN